MADMLLIVGANVTAVDVRMSCAEDGNPADNLNVLDGVS